MVDDDADELHVQAVTNSIRRALDDPNSAEEVERTISAIMGDEEDDVADEPAGHE